MTVMGIAARSLQIDLTGSKVTVQKEMTAMPLRRIGKLAVTIDVPVKVTDSQKQQLEKAALTCPVHKSLHPDVQMPITFNWTS